MRVTRCTVEGEGGGGHWEAIVQPPLWDELRQSFQHSLPFGVTDGNADSLESIRRQYLEVEFEMCRPLS
jgi:hypothetical protein